MVSISINQVYAGKAGELVELQQLPRGGGAVSRGGGSASRGLAEPQGRQLLARGAYVSPMVYWSWRKSR